MMDYAGGGGGFSADVLLQLQATRIKRYVATVLPYGKGPSWDSLPPDVQKGLSLGTFDFGVGGPAQKWTKNNWNSEYADCTKTSCPDTNAAHDLTGEPINQLIWTLGGMYFFSRVASGAAVIEAATSGAPAQAGRAAITTPAEFAGSEAWVDGPLVGGPNGIILNIKNATIAGNVEGGIGGATINASNTVYIGGSAIGQIGGVAITAKVLTILNDVIGRFLIHK
jgi:hypothetical protein